jgi:hypothetical protein
LIFTFDNKKYSDQPPPDYETLKVAVFEASEICANLGREIRRIEKDSAYSYTYRFYSDAFNIISKKILAVNKLGITFRNEANSLCRDLIEIIVDGAWIWFYFEIENKPDLSDRLCRQFYFNSKAHFLKEFDLLKRLYLNNPFLKSFYIEEKLERYKVDFRHVIGSYKYKSNWREIPKIITKQHSFWKTRCNLAGKVMEKYSGLKNADLYRNLSLLSGFTHWDSLQLEEANDELEEKTFHSNLNAILGLIHDLINLGYNIIDKKIPENIRIKRQRLIW